MRRLRLTGRRPVSSATRPAAAGQALVELALVVPIMLLVLLAATDLARLFSAGVSVSSAARAGAMEAAEGPTSFQAGQPCNALVNRVMCAVLTESSGSALDIAPDDVSLTCTPSPCSESLGSVVTVEVAGRFHLITPILAVFTGGQAIDLNGSATAQIAVRPNVAAASAPPTPTPAPTPTPSAAPTPGPTASPDPGATPGSSSSPVPSPSPSPTPTCFSPVADFTVSPTSGKKKKTDFQFTDLSTTAVECPLAWSWNFGDGAGSASTSNVQNPVHQYQAQGTYTITLVVSNAGGSATRSRTVTVTP